MNKSKEELKLKIQRIFTQLKKEISERENELLTKVDIIYTEIYFNDEDIIKKIEKLPNRIKLSLEKGKLIENEWNEQDNKLNSLINDCINIENNLNDITKLNDNIKKCNNINADIIFSPEENDINSFIEIIKNFGDINKSEDIDRYLK